MEDNDEINKVIRVEIESIESELKKIEGRIRGEKDHDIKERFTKLKAEIKKYKSEVVGGRTYNLRRESK